MEKIMDKKTAGIAYAIKRGNGTNFERIAKFMSQYTDTPIEYYNETNIERILIQAFSCILNVVERPGAVFLNYSNWKQYPWNYSNIDAMCAAINEIQVRKKDELTGTYKYINGFYELEGI